MKKTVSFSQLIGFIFVSVFGILLHFLYEWCGKNVFVGLFSAVNESTWEHMKLLFFPAFAYSLIQYRTLGKEYCNYWCVKLKGTVLGLILIPVLFYTLNGTFGKTSAFVNISIFFISTAAVFIYEMKLFNKSVCERSNCKTAFIILCIIGILFFLFTFITPEIPLFIDPTTLLYGMIK